MPKKTKKNWAEKARTNSQDTLVLSQESQPVSDSEVMSACAAIDQNPKIKRIRVDASVTPAAADLIFRTHLQHTHSEHLELPIGRLNTPSQKYAMRMAQEYPEDLDWHNSRLDVVPAFDAFKEVVAKSQTSKKLPELPEELLLKHVKPFTRKKRKTLDLKYI